jgi:hypothetical protein
VDVGHHLVLAGSLRTAAAASSADASNSSGSSSKLVLSLSVPKSHVTLLHSSTQEVGSSATAGPAAAAADSASAAGIAAAAASTDQQAHQDPSTQQQQQQQPGWPLCAFGGLQQLWVLLKDRLCLPLLVAGCAAAGRAAPLGLASMPYEMQEAVLALLGVSYQPLHGFEACLFGVLRGECLASCTCTV